MITVAATCSICGRDEICYETENHGYVCRNCYYRYDLEYEE